MRRALLVVLLLALPATGAARADSPEQKEKDVVLAAMEDELARTMERLRLGELSPPYFVEYRVVEVEEKEFSAAFGALVSSSGSHQRHLAADVRVGDYTFDNSHFIDMQRFGSPRTTLGTTALDNDYEALRQDLWLLTDGAYKTALEELAQKRAFVQGQRNPPEGADFSREEPLVFLEPPAHSIWNQRPWEEEVKEYSALCKTQAAVETCQASVHFTYTLQYLATSEGARVRQAKTLAAFEASAVALTEDGFRVNNFIRFYGRTPAELPSAAALRDAFERMLNELDSWRTAAELKHYAGPVLVEGPAAGPLLVQLLGSKLDGGRLPDGLPDVMAGSSELRGRLHTKILPAFLSLTDDPNQEAFQGETLLGQYPVDDEGVRAQRVEVVKDGTLENWLMSRRPGKDSAHSNGHGRAGLAGDAGARPANLFLTGAEPQTKAELEKQFLDLCREEGLEFCLVVSRLNDPSLLAQGSGGLRAMMQRMRMGGAAGVPALAVWKVYPEDGRREPVRGALLAGLRVRNLRDIAAAGDDYAVHNYLQVVTGVPGFDLMLPMQGMGRGASWLGLPSAVVAPSLLFEELEIRGASEEPEKDLVVPRPPLPNMSIPATLPGNGS